GIREDEVFATRAANDMNLSIGGYEDQVQLKNWYATNSPGVGFRIEGVYFDNGTVWDAENLESRLISEAGLQQMIEALATNSNPPAGAEVITAQSQEDTSQMVTAALET
ncbi:MAG: hypothetical protein MI673_07390, partial [Thiotrichales bacterium]|nr:hypothetical protein [Thiotrichales bacterium]